MLSSCVLRPAIRARFVFKPPHRGRPMVYDSVFRVRFRSFRRFYDLFLRRKHLESLVRVIRPFGVHLCATRAKNFRLDIFVRRIIMKIERDAAVSAVSPHTSNSRTMLTAWVAARRSTRFWSYVDHDRKDHDEAYRETQGSRPASVSHLHHPLSQGSG